MSSHLEQRKKGLLTKISEINDSIEAVKLIQQNKEHEGRFELNDTLYAQAKIPPSKIVYLWLGANILMEYPLSEGASLLQEKQAIAEKSLADILEDVNFIREQMTTVEVNMARVYNWTVKNKKLLVEK